jgi:hypothetical protein
MPQVVEINLRLPSFRIKATHEAQAAVVDNNDVRFIKRLEIDAIPKPGETLTLTTETGLSFPCVVVQVNWHDSNNIFVLSCRYGKQRISPEDYARISNAPDWTSRPLL